MKTGVIELAFTVSARDLDSTPHGVMYEVLFRTLRGHPVMLSLYYRLMLMLLFPVIWIVVHLDRDDPANRGGEGVRWGAQRMVAGPEDLTVRRAARTTVYRWAAIRELRKTRTMILLMLTSKHAILVPRRTFANRTAEKCFCHFVRDRIAEVAKSSQESLSAGYRYT